MNTFTDVPEPLRSFLIYIESIQGKSEKTANEYYYDLRTFYRFLCIYFKLPDSDVEFDFIDINQIDINIIKKIDLKIIYEYMNYLTRERLNSAASRARKIASLRSFFKYLTNKIHAIEENPITELDSVKIKKSLPKHLTVDDSIALLSSIDGENEKRDFCIITFFLNCGMRLSELVNIDIQDIRNDTITVLGKGNKERTIYLNKACLKAYAEYISLRNSISIQGKDKNALFISNRNKRISRRTVQYTVEKYIKKLGLDPRKYTTHKLRHTAATLMYQSGVDIRALKEILGHEQLSTTEIYTHVDNEQLRNAVANSPLANIDIHKNKQ